MGMLRISNVVQISLAQFDINKHLTREDLKINPKGIQIVLKWAKTMQTYRQGAVVILPYIRGSLMCPVNALNALNTLFPIHHTKPLFAYMVHGKIKYVSRSKIQNLLNLV
jgi:hypothetical protein